MRIGESAGVEQIGREHGVPGFFRFAVDVGIAEQAFVRPLAIPDVESDNDDVHVSLAACVRAPGEGTVRECDLQAATLEQERPELRHLLALGDRIGGDEADPCRSFLNVFPGLR